VSEEPEQPDAPAQTPEPRRRWRRLAVVAAVVVVLLGVAGTAAGAYYAAIELPPLSEPPSATTLYYADGKTVLARLGDQSRFVVDTKALPLAVRAAVLSAEDRDFDKGGPTNRPSVIARQYARIEFKLSGGNVRLIPMAAKLEQEVGKATILDRYLNVIYFGRGAYGIEAGARAYFGKPAAQLTREEAMVLAGVIESPGDGKYDPARSAAEAKRRWEYVKAGMVDPLGALTAADAARMQMPNVIPPADGARAVATFVPDGPAGLAAKQVAAELRQHAPMKGKPIHRMGYEVVTTIEAPAQQALERLANPKTTGSMLAGHPTNLQAAAVVVQPKTGRVLAYYAGDHGDGSDYAHWYRDEQGNPTGFGYHPPGASFAVYDLAAALGQGISLRSRWASPATMAFPRSRPASQPVTDTGRCPTGGTTCTLAESVTAGLNVPLFALTEQIGHQTVIETAHRVGIDTMRNIDGRRVDLGQAKDVRPGFTPEVGLGMHPITVLDHANGMATFAGGGMRANAHFVSSVSQRGAEIYRDGSQPRQVVPSGVVTDLTWALHQNRDGRLADGRSTAAVTGTWHVTGRPAETAHAWIAGFTPQYAMAVWVGNRTDEVPLKDRTGAQVTGSTLPALIYRGLMGAVHAGTLPAPVPAPVYLGDPSKGNAR
jgi:membrane peptidoglycan carboxypeptidase